VAKKITAYCGYETRYGCDHAYVKWAQEYLELTNSQRLDFLTEIISELEFERQFILKQLTKTV
jgi:hypothetical protein